MRILMLSQFYPPEIGGEERHVRTLSLEMSQRGHDVRVAALASSEDVTEEQDGILVHRLTGWAHRLTGAFQDPATKFAPPFPDPGVTTKLEAIVAEFRPHVVHAHNWIVNSYLPIRRRGGPPLVLTLHDYSHRCAAKRYMRADTEPCEGPGVVKCLLCAERKYRRGVGSLVATTNAMMWPARERLVDAVISVSASVDAGNRLQPRSQQSLVIPNFIPPVSDLLASADPTHLPDDWPDDPPILFVGDLCKDKGVEVLAEAHRMLGDAAPPLVLIGKPVDVAGLVAPNIKVFHSWPHGAVLAAMQRSSVVVLPSVCRDACPTVVLEAMACGRPVVATSTGGIVDLVADGVTGALVPPGQAAPLSVALARYMDDSARVEQDGRAGRARVEQFTVSSVAHRVENVYRRVADRGARAGASL